MSLRYTFNYLQDFILEICLSTVTHSVYLWNELKLSKPNGSYRKKYPQVMTQSSECVRLAYCHTVFAHPVASPNSHQKKKKGPI